VLVVDDEPVILRLLHRLLGDDYEVTDACDGPTALTAWRDSPTDVIVLDQMMPDMTGLDVARQILAENPDQRIVLFTTATYGNLIGRAVDVGIRAVVQKTDVTQVADVIADVLVED
jgi:CheY-like chemotaxis protein